MQDSCPFCNIVRLQAQADIDYQDDQVTAFWDEHPAAPVHILLVPNKHISSLDTLEAEDENLIGHLFMIVKLVARKHNLHEKGYRIIMNTGRGAGQSVFHLHVHLLSGRHFGYHTRWNQEL